MDILLVLGSLVTALIWVSLSCARSYFETGRLRGMEEATREIGRGVSSHCELDGGIVPVAVEKAMAAVKAVEYCVKAGGLPVNVRFLIEGEEEITGESLGRYVRENAKHY